MLFLQNAPVNTTGYYIAGYAVIFIAMALYLFSIFHRFSKLEQDLEVLKELDSGKVEE